MAKRHVYFFGGGEADGKGDMKELLGGKGANLAEMSRLGIPVPAGFTITTGVCTTYYDNNGKIPESVVNAVDRNLRRVEKIMSKKFGSEKNPLLVSVRSGARRSMPGMMDTVLNVGLTTKTLPGLIHRTGDERFAYDAYRRLITMYADVVMEKASGYEPADGETIREKLENALAFAKDRRAVEHDHELTADDLKALCVEYKRLVRDALGKPFPDTPEKQLWGAIKAVFQSWNGKRARDYRRIEGIPGHWGTAVNVQAMVFGNMGETSATGVAFTRHPSTGENVFFGEWLANAQGEDVVAGIRTPAPLNLATKPKDDKTQRSLEETMPKVYKKLETIRRKLEKHYRDMQDIEFTIEDGELWMLQTRTGKRTGPAAIRIAVELVEARQIGRREAILRVMPKQLDELLHPMLDPDLEQKKTPLASGLPAGPGGAVGRVVFTADDAEKYCKAGESVVLVRNETSPEDVHGMHAARAILTARGGMTSHAAVVARGWGKCCIVGCSALGIDVRNKSISVNGVSLNELDWISLNGSTGKVYEGQLDVLPARPEKNQWYERLMKWVDRERTLKVRANAESPGDAQQAIRFGAEGIGLARTEHMFFEPDRIVHMRRMILVDNEEERRAAVMKLLPYQKSDFIGIFKAMEGKPVTVRLLDPPLHEFLALDSDQIRDLAAKLNIGEDQIRRRMEDLEEANPMLGHRGCRLGISYPEITEMQARAILEAAAELQEKGTKVLPEIMIPLVGSEKEFLHQHEIVTRVAKAVKKETGVRVRYLVGTMIEIPRACLVADKIAEHADFFSFGTNDLTQMGFGFSRDDAGSFLPNYIESGIITDDPFQTLDQAGIGTLIEWAVESGRETNPKLKIGICGEHGGDPESVRFFHVTGLDYVSCSPFRVPIARLAAAQVAIENEN